MAHASIALRPITILPLRLHRVAAAAAPFSAALVRLSVPRPKACCVLHKCTVLAAVGGKESGANLGIHKSPSIRAQRRLFKLRVRARLRLFWRKFRRLSIRDVARNAVAGLRRGTRFLTPRTLLPILLGALFWLMRCAYLSSKNASKEIAYSELVSRLQRRLVNSVAFEEDTGRIYFNEVKQRVVESKQTANGHSKPKWEYFARKINGDEAFLMGLMRKKGVSYKLVPQSGSKALMSILMTLLTLWLSLVPMVWFLQRMLNSSSAAAKKRRPQRQDIGFGDVEGVDAAKAELKEIVSCLQGSLDYKKLGAKLPKGILLAGPPGTGKTLLARAVAGEAGIPFFSVSASEFVEVFVGRGAARVRDLFCEAKEFAPSIIFIDELDAVGGKRGRSFNDERDQTLNQLLTEMDGFESDIRVVVIAATNRPEALDRALCRPGRFSRKVIVGVPDLDGRKKILGVHLRGVPLEEDSGTISNMVASLTPGFVGADLANIVNEAALLAARRGGKVVTREDIMDAVEREKYGVNGKSLTADAGKKGLAKLLPWFSNIGRNNLSGGAMPALMGYQTLN